MNKKLLFSITAKDFRFDFYRGSGKGGQHRNKTSSACRATHIESGAVGQAEDERSQHQNKKIAFKRCVETKKFQNWLSVKNAEILGTVKTSKEIEKEVDDIINRDLSNGNIIIEKI